MTTDDWRRLDHRVRIVWWVGSTINDIVVMGGLALLGFVVSSNSDNPITDRWYVVPLVLGVVSIPLRLWYVRAAYRAWRYRFAPDHLELQHGVLWRQTSSMPYHRLQQVDEGQGPLERRFDIATVELRSAAATTDATIPGIATADVDEIRRLLMQRAGRDDGA